MPGEIPEDKRIYISELSQIIMREVDTIRKWEYNGKLPENLIPERGFRNRRYWSHAQVYGKYGIIAWMKKNDMRPGNTFSHRSNEAKHIEALRRPKFISKRMVRNVRQMTRNHTPLEEILAEIYPHTKYASPENCEYALRRYFDRQGWVFPPYDDSERKGVVYYDDY